MFDKFGIWYVKSCSWRNAWLIGFSRPGFYLRHVTPLPYVLKRPYCSMLQIFVLIGACRHDAIKLIGFNIYVSDLESKSYRKILRKWCKQYISHVPKAADITAVVRLTEQCAAGAGDTWSTVLIAHWQVVLGSPSAAPSTAHFEQARHVHWFGLVWFV